MRTWRTGEFARETGVSPRTIRYYDRLGLLSPAARTEAGYRLFDERDLARLQHILALKFLGFALAEIRAALDGSSEPAADLITRQEALLREQRARLDRVIDAAARARRELQTGDDGWRSVVSVIGAFQMEQDRSDWQQQYLTEPNIQKLQNWIDEAYSPEARTALAARAAWTEEDQRRVDEQYAALYAGVRAAVADGLTPASATGQELAARANALIDAFTLGNPEIAAGLQVLMTRLREHKNDAPEIRLPYNGELSEAETAFLEEAKRIHRGATAQ